MSLCFFQLAYPKKIQLPLTLQYFVSKFGRNIQNIFICMQCFQIEKQKALLERLDQSDNLNISFEFGIDTF